MKRLFTVLAVLVGVVLTTGIAVADEEYDRSAIRKATEGALKAAQAKDVGQWITFYTDDAALFPPNEPVVKGKEAIHDWLSEAVANPDFNVNWQTTKVEVSGGGDLGFASGTYEVTLNDCEGKSFTERGKWVAVFKKETDETWKYVDTIWNTDQPPA